MLACFGLLVTHQAKLLTTNAEQNVSCGLNASLASQDDNLTGEEIGVLVDTFPGQPLDFFGAIR